MPVTAYRLRSNAVTRRTPDGTVLDRCLVVPEARRMAVRLLPVSAHRRCGAAARIDFRWLAGLGAKAADDGEGVGFGLADA